MSTNPVHVGDILFGQIRGRVLALLFADPDQSYFLRQVARHAQTSAGNVRRELSLLERAGIVQRAAKGKQVFFEANRNHPAFAEFRALIGKTVGAFALLKTALAPLGDKIGVAFVFGSTATGNERPESDVDLMIVGTVSLDEVLEAIQSVEKQVGRTVNPVIFSCEDLRAKLGGGNHFLRSLQSSKKVFLIGDDDGFARACSERLVQG